MAASAEGVDRSKDVGQSRKTSMPARSCRGCPLRSVAEHKVESENGRLEVTLTVDVVNLITPNTTFKTRLYNGALGGPRLVLHLRRADSPGRRVAATPRLRDVNIPSNESRRRRGRDVDVSWRRVAATPRQ